jgi:hypothetical protein
MKPALILSCLLISLPAAAQEAVKVPLAATFGPARLTAGQTLRVCVANLFGSALLTSQLPARPLPVKVAFVDSVKGELLQPAKDLDLTMPKGACEDFTASAEVMAVALVVPMSAQDAKVPSSELIPICSATVLDGSGTGARSAAVIPMVPKANLLIPRVRP